ncbi:MAG: hypothetical protein JSW60_06485 [Thermoplasmatales archaeon]|nr:MAG: hypothetical protein JSW60_06485 [Thermoplasmatales archaeon]
MNEKYKSIIRNVDKLSGKTIERKTNKEYKSIIKEIDKVIGKSNEEGKLKSATYT